MSGGANRALIAVLLRRWNGSVGQTRGVPDARDGTTLQSRQLLDSCPRGKWPHCSRILARRDERSRNVVDTLVDACFVGRDGGSCVVPWALRRGIATIEALLGGLATTPNGTHTVLELAVESHPPRARES
jgi:hypothetical protein